MLTLLGGVAFWGGLGGWLFLIRARSSVHQAAEDRLPRKKQLALATLAGGLILLMGFLMTLSPIWNGEIPGHRNQYELITESFLQGRLDFDYEVDPALLAMENPYDMEQRDALGVKTHFDHAFYNGKYYMYFGVVPVLIAFLPFRLLSGHALVTWVATFLFTAGFMIGLAAYLRQLVRKYFQKMTWGAYLSLLIVFSLASAVYVVKYPSLYQTPVACGMMLEIWSLYCFSKAFNGESGDFSLGLALAGALMGALTFGCRPPLAMANLLILPLLIRFLKGKKMAGKRFLRLICAAVPYALVAAGLMWYNAARFDNPFEFGQTYQITIVDQTAYSSMFTVENLVRAPAGIFNSLFVVAPVDMLFPYLRTGSGAFAICPLLLLSLSFLLSRPRKLLKERRLLGMTVTIMLTVMLIAALHIIWSPKILDRYQSDYVWLLSIGAFCGAGACFAGAEDGRKLSRTIALVSFACVILTALVFLIPADYSYTDYDGNAIVKIWNFLTFRAFR